MHASGSLRCQPLLLMSHSVLHLRINVALLVFPMRPLAPQTATAQARDFTKRPPSFRPLKGQGELEIGVGVLSVCLSVCVQESLCSFPFPSRFMGKLQLLQRFMAFAFRVRDSFLPERTVANHVPARGEGGGAAQAQTGVPANWRQARTARTRHPSMFSGSLLAARGFFNTGSMDPRPPSEPRSSPGALTGRCLLLSLECRGLWAPVFELSERRRSSGVALDFQLPRFYGDSFLGRLVYGDSKGELHCTDGPPRERCLRRLRSALQPRRMAITTCRSLRNTLLKERATRRRLVDSTLRCLSPGLVADMSA